MRKATRLYTWLGYISIIYLLILFIYPILRVTITSFWNQGLTLENYVDALSSPLYLEVLMKTCGCQSEVV